MAVIDESVSDEEASAPPLDDEQPAEMLFGAGQSTWLAIVTVVALLSLAVSFVALFMASDATTDGGTASPTTAPFLGPQAELTIVSTEFAFDPQGVAIFADTDTPVVLDNVGAVEHNWTVLAAGTTISSEDDFDESTVIAQVTALPGETIEGSVNLAEGSYQLICTIAGHFSAGMEGVLEVESA